MLHDESIQVRIQEYLIKTDEENKTLIQFTITIHTYEMGFIAISLKKNLLC